MKIRDLPQWRSLNISETLHKWLMQLKLQVTGTVNDASFLVISESDGLDSARVWADGKGIDSVDGGPGGTFTPGVDESELSHALLGSLNTTNYSHLTAAQLADLTDAGDSELHYHASDRNSDNFYGTEWEDLTDGGATTLHKHDHGGQDGLADDDHTQYVLRTQWLQNGFVDPTEVSLSWDDGNRRLTISPTGASFRYFQAGILYTITTPKTATITDTEGLWVFYFSATSNLLSYAASHSVIDAVIEDYCVVALVYWDAANNDGRLFSELHGYRMSPATHHYLHDNVGAVYKTGMAIEDISTEGDGSDNAHAQFGVAEGAFYDEDLEVELDAIASTVGLEVWYLDGANWRWDTNAGYPVLTAGTGRLAWNSSGSVVEVDNTKFVLCHVFATNICLDDGTSPYYIAIMGQAQYATLAAARAGAETEMGNLATGDLPMPEIVPVATVIYQTQDSYTNAVNARTRSTASGEDWIDWRTSNIVASGAISDHGGLAGLTDDDHAQYLLSAGRSGGQSGAGGTAAGESLALEGSAHASGGPITLNANLSIDADGDVTLTKDGDDSAIRQTIYGSGISPSFIGEHAANILGDPDPSIASSTVNRLLGRGHDGTDFVDSAAITLQTAAAFSGSEAGGKIKLQTVLIGDTGRVLDDRVVIDGYGNVIINAGATARPDSMYAGLVMKDSVAPTANVDADCVCLYTKDVAAGHAFWHAMDEGEQEYTLVGAIQKTTTGDPTATHKSAIAVNTEDDTVKMVCEKGGAAQGWNEFLFVEDANFRTYKAIAMCCDNGTTFPTSPAPATGQWFYRTDTKTLWFYEGAWKAIISFGDITMYVSKAGADLPPDGWAGDAPMLTIQEAINRIPSMVGGNVTINIGAGTYDESLVIGGKTLTGNSTITLQGVLGADVTSTQTSDGVLGAGAVQGSVNATDLMTGHADKLIYLAADGDYRIIDSVDAGGDIATIVGTFTTPPLNTEAFVIYDWDVIVSGVTSLTISDGQKGVVINDISLTGSSKSVSTSGGSVTLNRCKMTNWTQATQGGYIYFNTCIKSVASGSLSALVRCDNRSSITMHRTKIFGNGLSACRACWAFGSSVISLNLGTIIDSGSPNSNWGLNVKLNSFIDCNAGSAGGYIRVRNSTTGVHAEFVGEVVATTNNQYSGNTTNETASLTTTYAYID